MILKRIKGRCDSGCTGLSNNLSNLRCVNCTSWPGSRIFKAHSLIRVQGRGLLSNLERRLFSLGIFCKRGHNRFLHRSAGRADWNIVHPHDSYLWTRFRFRLRAGRSQRRCNVCCCSWLRLDRYIAFPYIQRVMAAAFRRAVPIVSGGQDLFRQAYTYKQRPQARRFDGSISVHFCRDPDQPHDDPVVYRRVRRVGSRSGGSWSVLSSANSVRDICGIKHVVADTQHWRRAYQQ